MAELAAGQEGLFADYQLAEAGGRRRLLEAWRREGRLTCERNRVYGVVGAPYTELRPLKAAELAGAPNVAASHFGAGWVHQSPYLVTGRVELTSFGKVHRRLEGVRLHESQFLAPEHVEIARGILTTTPARTVADLAASLNLFLLKRVYRDFERRDLCTADELAAIDLRLGGRGRAGTRAVRAVIADAREIAPGDSDLETRIMRQLLDFGLPPPVQQFQVVIGGRVYIIDLAWPRQRVGLEVDGFESRSTREALEHDTDRTNAFTAAGWDLYHATARTDIAALAPQLHRAILRG